MVELLKHPITLLLVAGVSILVGLSFYRTIQRTRTSTEAIRVLEQENAKMASEVSELKQEVTIAQSPLAQEKIIRNELLMQKPGEYIIQIPELEISETEVSQEQSRTPWQAWKEVWL